MCVMLSSSSFGAGGAPGTSLSVAYVLSMEYAPVPSALTAATEKVWLVPGKVGVSVNSAVVAPSASSEIVSTRPSTRSAYAVIGTPLSYGAAHETRSDVCGDSPGSGSIRIGSLPASGTSGVVTVSGKRVGSDRPAPFSASTATV